MGFENIYSGSTFGRNRTKIRQMFRDIFLGPFQIGTSPNYAEFETDGTLVFKGNATVWDDIQGNLAGRLLSSTAGKINYNWSENTITFNSGGNIATEADRLIWNIQLYHATKADSNFDLHMHWEQVDAVAREFTVQYRVQNNGDAKVTAWTTVVVPVGGGSTGDKFAYTSGTLNQITDLLDIDLTGLGISAVLEFRLARTDAVAGDIETTFVDGHVEKDTLGSREEYVK